ncbi:CTI6 [Candida theae]|uniref:CTI6 n=1 Tax=Candida theae TaxID=1198502 RepID=A0AAD5BH05_9ASCO|nr:CTI6 [Candida theae]KAI5961332.1 CTI6 [Candida theae]
MSSRRTRRRSLSTDTKPIKPERGRAHAEVDDARGVTRIGAAGNEGGGEEEEEEEEDDLEEGGDEADEEDEDGEITRCICKQDELQSDSINPEFAQFLKRNYKINIDQGLFISCEKCGVWQHGYCVGLFTNDDVPDLYWCELCKPENHLFVKGDGYSKRTLYKPVNDKRKKIESFGIGNGIKVESMDNSSGSKRRRVDRVSPPTTNANTTATTTQSKDRRKDRRTHHHHSDEDEYDEQLRKALRESAKESGLPVDESDATGTVSTGTHATALGGGGGASAGGAGGDHYSPRKRTSRGVSGANSEADNDSSLKREYEDEDSETGGSTAGGAGGNKSSTNARVAADLRKSRNKSNGKKKREGFSTNPAKSSNSSTTTGSGKANSPSSSSATSTTAAAAAAAAAAQASKDELINAPYKPRFVNSQSSIYDLRKRTSAIIEWIARTQYDLQQERNYKFELFSFTPDSEAISEEKSALEASYNDKLMMIDDLQRKINEWEIRFGKYAP